MILGILVNIVASFKVDAQVVCDYTYLQEYTANGNLEPYATKSLNNGEVLVAGKGTIALSDIYKAMTVKISSSGRVVWSVMISGNIDDRFIGITPLVDGSYLLYGTTFSFGFVEGKVLLVHLSSSGNLLWSKQLGIPGNSRDRIKAVKQFSDGDLIGTLNTNDSTDLSDPVVFKMGLNGVLKWVRRFDNHAAESFTSIGFENNNIYVSGFYTDVKRCGVMTILNSLDGSVKSSQKLYYNDGSYDQEVTNMEVDTNKLSYGLWLANNTSNKMLIYQTDLKGNKTFGSLIDDYADKEALFFKRTPADGFLTLSSMKNAGYNPDVIKFNKFNRIEWSTFQSTVSFNRGQTNHELDVTNEGGSVSAGYYPDYNNGAINKMAIAKISISGEAGSCAPAGNTFSVDTVSLFQSSFSWPTESAVPNFINEPVFPAILSFDIVENKLCDSTYCTDITPLPEGCNKTSLVEYSSNQNAILRDFVNTNDGGKVAVGDIAQNGFIVKFNNNGDVAWSKKVDYTNNNQLFRRVIKLKDNNIIAFANNYFTRNHYSYSNVKVIKLNEKGKILISKEIGQNGYDQISDVFATPDGGFVILLNESYGSGYVYSYVIRFDSNLQVIWEKKLSDAVNAPIYRSLFCTADGVFIANDSYNSYNTDKIGLQKLNFVNGNVIWSKRFVFANNLVRINKLIVSDDSLYVFLNNFTPFNPFMAQNSMYLLKVSEAGSIINVISLNGDKMTYIPFSYDYLDEDRPTVTITPAKDFVMSNQVKTADGLQLNISRFDKKGGIVWSKNYPGLSSQFVYNIHPDAKGFSIVGTSTSPHLRNPLFTNTFLLKVDSSGEIIHNSTGNCAYKSAPLSVSSISVQETDYGIDSEIDVQDFQILNTDVSTADVAYDATLFCNQKINCPSVLLSAIGNGCNRNDTLIYYLSNNDCGAAAMWKYDTAFFKLVSLTEDSLKLLPQKTGTSFIFATIKDDCSTITDSILASVSLKASSLNLGQDISLCPGDSIILNAGSGYDSYLWNNLATDSIITISSPGIYFVKVKDKCGEESIDSITISSVENAFHISGDSVKCNKDTVILLASTGYNNYEWSPSINLIQNNNAAKVSPLLTTIYYVSAEKFPGCIVKDSFLLTVKTSPPLNLEKDTIVCYDKSVILTAPDGFKSYAWSNGSQSSSTEVFTPGFFYITATYTNDCISKDTIEVKKFPFLKPYLGNDTSICRGAGFHLFPGNYKSYEWSNGVTTSNSIIVNSNGEYWVKVIDQYNCVASDTINILNVYNSPANFLGNQIDICFGDVVTLQPTKQFENYLWSTGAVSRFLSVKEVGVYKLSVTDANGCVGTDTIVVGQKQECPLNIYFFNAFTPNKDGLNDQFHPIIKGLLEKYSFKIYNSFGEMVFSTSIPSLGWDGTFKGELQPGGSYVFVCSYKFPGYTEVFKKGSFVLIR